MFETKPQVHSFSLKFICDLNLAIGKFAGDARHRSYRRINILQSFGNKADSVKLPIPKGSKYAKNMIHE